MDFIMIEFKMVASFTPTMVMFGSMEVKISLTVLNSKSMIRSPRLKLELLLDS
jgi:hypothetical protein